jgi:alpha-mannosidase
MLKIAKIDPTVLFTKEHTSFRRVTEEQNELTQVVEVTIENKGQAVEASLNVKFRSQELNINLGNIKESTGTYKFYIPDIRETMPVEFTLKANNEIQDRLTMNWIPRKHWEIYMIPISHHDLGYTDTIEHVLRQYCEIYEDVLRFCEETENYPDEAKFRYMVEGAWSLQHFIQKSDKATHEKLAKYIKEGRIEVPALFGNQISDMCSHEELIRLMYPSFRINREFGGKIGFGSITDIPGLCWGLPTVLSGAGIKYFFAGLPNYFEWGRNDIHTFWDEKNILRPHGKPDAFRWKGIDGSEILVYYQGSYGCWSPRSCEQVEKELPVMLNDMDDKGCPFSVMRYGGYGCGDNTGTDIIVSHLVREWNSKWAYPKLIVSTSSMFFEKLDEQCEDVRTFSGDLPHTDYSVGAMSSAKETTINRVTHDKLHSAEKLATMSHLLLKSNYPADDIRDAYDNMLLYDEHTWGMAHQVGYIQDWAWSEKSSYAYKASGLTELIFSGSARNIANSIAFDGEGQHIVVFNTLSFSRTDLVNIPNFLIEEPFEIIDTETGQKVPHQIIELDSPQSPVPHSAGRYARGQFNPPERFNLAFVAEDVPAMGYKTYQIVSAKDTVPASNCLILNDTSIESRFFKVRLNPETGTVESIYDKELGIELVDKDASHQVNQMITRWVKTGEEESPKVAIIRKGQNGPVYASLVVSTSGDGCPQLTQEIILYDKLKRIDFSNQVLKDSTPTMEVYFAFPFKMDCPDFRFEAPNSVIKPLRDQLPGTNSNYYSVQHWADVSDGNIGITFTPVDVHLVEFGGLHPCYVSQAHHGFTSPNFGADFVKEMTKGYMYSFAIDSNFRTNFQATQLGDILFRYSITAHKGDWINGRPRDFGWAIGNPLIPVPVDDRRKGNLPKSMSLCQIDKSNILLMTLKKAEDGEGIIIRLIETEGHDTEVSVTLPHVSIEKVYETNLVEENENMIAVQGQTITTKVKAFGIKTIRIM